jgi:DNA primase
MFMAGLIPRQFIDEILERTDIVELINARVPLKKAGKNHQACCPFHTEKSPSFTVSQDKQFYHCFGCGAHGNAISFIMEYDRLEFTEAIEELASHLGLTVPREQTAHSPAIQQKQQQAQQQKQLDFELMEQIAQFYRQQLKRAPDSQVAIDYLKQRGLTGEIAKQYSIGYVSDQWDLVVSQFGKTPQQQQQLIDLGMAIKGDKPRPYDRFRGRIMFPIRDKRGRVIGFGGRIISEGTPKYLNSPETRLYHKGQELYGLYEAKTANKQLDRIVVVEGYMDVVALAQHGISYAVASLGTSTTPEQLQTLFRQTKEVICCYDGDNAGRDAAWRAMENALPMIRDHISLKFVFLPDGEDPDSLVRAQGKSAFEALLNQAKPLSQFLIDQLLQQGDVSSIEGRAALLQSFQPYLDKLPDGNIKTALIDTIAKKFGMSSEQQLKLQQGSQSSNKKPRVTKQKTTPMRMAMALLIEQPALANEVELAPLKAIDIPGTELLLELLAICQQNPTIKTAQLLEYFRDHPQQKVLSKLACWQHMVAPDAMAAVFIDSIERILTQFIENRTEQLLQKARTAQISEREKKELQTLLNNSRA